MGGTSSAQSCNSLDKSTYTLKQHYYTWEIKDFVSLNYESGKSLQTSYLKLDTGFGEGSWTLILYPHGYNTRVKNYLSLWFKKVCADEVLLKFTCAVLDSEGEVFYSKSVMRNLCLESFLGWATFCSRSDILDEKNSILQNGNLVLKCSVEVYAPKETMLATVDDEIFLASDMTEMGKNFDSLLESKNFSDLTICCEDEEFRVHKAILSARSPVFLDHMQSNLSSRNSRYVIDDVSKNTVSELIKYIYSGQIGFLNFKLASELFYVANKYELFCLKRKCSKFLAGNLKVEQAVSVLRLANENCDNWLRIMATDFITKNQSQISETESWLSLLKDEPELANSVFISLSKMTLN